MASPKAISLTEDRQSSHTYWPTGDENLPTTNPQTIGMSSLHKMEDGVKTGTKPKRQVFPEDLTAHEISILKQKRGSWSVNNSFICNDLCVFRRR
jgi:hypothetical protein